MSRRSLPEPFSGRTRETETRFAWRYRKNQIITPCPLPQFHLSGITPNPWKRLCLHKGVCWSVVEAYPLQLHNGQWTTWCIIVGPHSVVQLIYLFPTPLSYLSFGLWSLDRANSSWCIKYSSDGWTQTRPIDSHFSSCGTWVRCSLTRTREKDTDASNVRSVQRLSAISGDHMYAPPGTAPANHILKHATRPIPRSLAIVIE